MQIVVISLPDASARREQARQQLKSLGLLFDFIDALDGGTGAREFARIDERRHLIHTGRSPAPGEIGCYASHLVAWKRCIELDAPLCVLEDDFQAEEFLPAALDTAEKWTDRCGFVRLQTESRGAKYRIGTEGRFAIHRYTKMPHSTLAYIITPRVAQAFVEHSLIMREPADVFIKRFWSHRQPLYGLTPYAARESTLAAESDIASRVRRKKSLAIRIQRSATRLSWFFQRTTFNLTHRDKRR